MIEPGGGVQCTNAPGGSIWAVPVDVEPGLTVVTNEVMDAELADRASRPFLHPAVERYVGAGLLRPWVRVGAHRAPFEPKRFVWSIDCDRGDGPWATKLEWWAKGPGFYARLWTFLGRGDCVMPWEALVAFEDLASTHFELRGGVEIGAGDSSALIGSRTWTPGPLPDAAGLLDRQGLPLEGAFLFWTPDEIETLLGEWDLPLVAAPQSRFGFGVWDKEPFASTEGEAELQLSKKWDSLRAMQSDPLSYVGWIGSKRPSDTGEQGGFGNWQAFDSWAFVGSNRAQRAERTLWLDGQIARREALRPIFFFEPETGELVLARNHRDYVALNEGPHFDNNVCPDKLGRKEQTGGFYPPDWMPNDPEHDVSHLWPSVDVLANDSEVSRLVLKMKAQHWIAGNTLPSQKPKWSTNGPGSGRQVGRAYLNIAENWRATGDLELLEHAKRRFHECIEPLFKDPLPPIPVFRVIEKDDRVFDGKKPGWICWEDAIFCIGLDAFARVCADFGWTETAMAVQRVVDAVAASILRWAFWTVPDEGGRPVLKMASRISWELRGQEFPAWWYEDDSFVVDDRETAYKLWSRGVCRIGQRWRNDPARKAMAVRADSYLEWMGEPVGYFMQRYDGVR